jgi:hypothetical protein
VYPKIGVQQENRLEAKGLKYQETCRWLLMALKASKAIENHKAESRKPNQVGGILNGSMPRCPERPHIL